MLNSVTGTGKGSQRGRDIAERAAQVFFEQGYAAVTMEHVAALQGISKKTLYRHFPNKKALLLQVIENRLEGLDRKLEEAFAAPDLDFTRKLPVVLELVVEMFTQISMSMVRDLYYHAPDAWQRIEDFRHEQIYGRIEKLIRQGIVEGYVRPDLDPRMFSALLEGQVRGFLNPQVMVRLSVSILDAFRFMLDVLYNGILTEKAGGRLSRSIRTGHD